MKVTWILVAAFLFILMTTLHIKTDNAYRETIMAHEASVLCTIRIETLQSEIDELSKQLELTANSGQFDVGAYWAYRAVETFLSQKQSPTINDILLRAKSLHAAAVMESVAVTVAKEAEARLQAEAARIKDEIGITDAVVTEKRPWWRFW